jgi:hypothetical protein
MTTLLHFVFRFLEVCFMVGLIGSLLVICITTVEDLKVLFEKDVPAPGTLSEPKPTGHEALDHAVIAK